MSSAHPNLPKAASEEIPPVPLTIEGYSVLHQMMRIRWGAWRQLPAAEKTAIVDAAAVVLGKMETNANGQSGLFSLLGHKGDLMFVHFRRSFDELNQVELQLAQLALNDYLEPATSYLSVIELGLYESTIKAYQDLKARGHCGALGRMEARDQRCSGAAEGSDAPSTVSGTAQASLPVVLSDGPAAR